MTVDPRNMHSVVGAILDGTATSALCHMATAHHAERRAVQAEFRRDNPHKCAAGRCCWHDPAPFRAIRDEYIAKAIQAEQEGR